MSVAAVAWLIITIESQSWHEIPNLTRELSLSNVTINVCDI